MTPEAHAAALLHIANRARSFAALAAAQLCEAHLRHRKHGRTIEAHECAANLASLRRHVDDTPALASLIDSTVTALCPHLAEPGADGTPPFYPL